MQLNPYLMFKGNCEAAFKHYERCLGGKIVAMITFGDTPMAAQAPAETHGQIAHARLVAGDHVLMGSDCMPEHFEPMKGFSVTLSVDAPADAERIFGALSEGGTVTMPLQETFWALRFGTFTDRFGTPWMINCEKPRPS